VTEALGADRGVHDQRRSLPGEVVDDSPDPEAEPSGRTVEYPSGVGRLYLKGGAVNECSYDRS